MIIARIKDGISNPKNEYGDCAKNINCDREIKTSNGARLERFRHLTEVTVLIESWEVTSTAEAVLGRTNRE